MTEKLFRFERQCIACDAATTAHSKPGNTVIVSINVTLYRRTMKTGRQLHTTRQVRVCETCLAIALASRDGGTNSKAQILAQAMFGRIAERYSVMCGDFEI